MLALKEERKKERKTKKKKKQNEERNCKTIDNIMQQYRYN